VPRDLHRFVVAISRMHIRRVCFANRQQLAGTKRVHQIVHARGLAGTADMSLRHEGLCFAANRDMTRYVVAPIRIV